MDKLEKKVDNRMTVRILGLNHDAKPINRRFKVAKGTSVAQLHRLATVMMLLGLETSITEIVTSERKDVPAAF
ncbi:hypothetical protein [Weissella confusa]|uniref:hypothetical protein n=1 Tax=Weissella confusa TaxID=1583 RepID=UPI0018F24D25|nr:hypothetical protein [Weissella confusa]MBJ7685600.1 hypothetical protein [Weissella confusa]MBJ7695877.1 hypothetical protein [Weissella confusa]